VGTGNVFVQVFLARTLTNSLLLMDFSWEGWDSLLLIGMALIIGSFSGMV
jgi:hypothetical protein